MDVRQTDFQDSLDRGMGGACHISGTAEALACPQRVVAFARSMGFDETTCAKLHIAASELCTNVLRHGVRGLLSYAMVSSPEPGILVVAEDEGPGFDDIELARRDGVSRGVDLGVHVAPARRQSLGSGLGAIERLTHGMEVENLPGGGARIAFFAALRKRGR